MRTYRPLIGVLLAVAVGPRAAWAQGMALTPPSEVVPVVRTVPLPPPRPLIIVAPARASPNGRLPEQATGQKHEHVVHDICIGC